MALVLQLMDKVLTAPCICMGMEESSWGIPLTQPKNTRLLADKCVLQ
jgi:hypothetical protein